MHCFVWASQNIYCMCAECYLALPGIKRKAFAAENPRCTTLPVALIGAINAVVCPFVWVRHKKNGFHQVQPIEYEHV